MAVGGSDRPPNFLLCNSCNQLEVAFAPRRPNMKLAGVYELSVLPVQPLEEVRTAPLRFPYRPFNS